MAMREQGKTKLRHRRQAHRERTRHARRCFPGGQRGRTPRDHAGAELPERADRLQAYSWPCWSSLLGFLGALFYQDVDVCFNPVERAAAARSSAPSTRPPTRRRQAGDLDQLTNQTASRWDVPAILILGATAAALSAAVALRQVKGSSTPFSLPVALGGAQAPDGGIDRTPGPPSAARSVHPGVQRPGLPRPGPRLGSPPGLCTAAADPSDRPACPDRSSMPWANHPSPSRRWR